MTVILRCFTEIGSFGCQLRHRGWSYTQHYTHTVCDNNVARGIVFGNIWFMVIFSVIIEKECVKARYPSRLVQHCTAISAIAELLLTLASIKLFQYTFCIELLTRGPLTVQLCMFYAIKPTTSPADGHLYCLSEVSRLCNMFSRIRNCSYL